MEGLSSDSVWNFHVWNEVWLKGTGHWPEKYAGWAAVDATPQEESLGMMQCGPAPLKARGQYQLLLKMSKISVFAGNFDYYHPLYIWDCIFNTKNFNTKTCLR